MPNGDNHGWLSIKVVPQDAARHSPPEPGGGPRKVFGTVGRDQRLSLAEQFNSVLEFRRTFGSAPDLPNVAVVKLKRDALAKSHRPVGLLNEDTCPIIGAESFGDLFVRVLPAGLQQLNRRVLNDESKAAQADMSTIETIRPYSERDVLGASNVEDLSAQLTAGRTEFKVRLFEQHDGALDRSVLRHFFALTSDIDVPEPLRLNYATGENIYRVRLSSGGQIVRLAQFAGARRVSPIPKYWIAQQAATPIGPMNTADFPPPATQRIPVVGLFDSGVDPQNQYFDPWITDRVSYVPQAQRDSNHGSFVAGLLVNARSLNHGDARFPNVHSRLVDVCVMSPTSGLSEDQLIAIIEEVVPTHPEVRFWNLSLGTDELCQDQSFSDFGMKLDELQDRFGVLFTIAAGNYTTLPLRGWPPENLAGADRLCAPGDSTRAITIGSLAHVHNAGSRVQSEEPSPFSRRGPGGSFCPKPEVVHYGGNCDSSGRFLQTGVVSVNSNRELAENVGTSFAAPLVCTLLANLDGAVVHRPSTNLAKALIVHSAMLRNDFISASELNYRGFGVPPDLPTILSCPPSAATLVFELNIEVSLEYEYFPFPIPTSMRSELGNVTGSIVMTLVYNPPLDPSYGAEYCRTNVEVSLGTFDADNGGTRHHKKQVPAEPRDMKGMYERELIEHGFKWSPVKVYRRNMPRGIQGNDWRLLVTAHNRADYASTEPQPIALIITLIGPSDGSPVYDQTVTLMHRFGWGALDLQVRERVRARR